MNEEISRNAPFGRKVPRFGIAYLLQYSVKPTPAIFPIQMMMQPQGDPTGEHDPKDPDCYCEFFKRREVCIIGRTGWLKHENLG
ncbi:hypothetical protein V6N11_022828 [Hibiscus sabdariffa]|uniref:Uncharacterized protein n=1 Tax=Hibiscus sabdariffa TaxID=183260 RepID=A0ABR2TKD6_9ROSI